MLVIACAQFRLGGFYYEGQGVTQNYQKAAERGFANAQYKVGLMYEKGEGLRKISPKQSGGFLKRQNKDIVRPKLS